MSTEKCTNHEKFYLSTEKCTNREKFCLSTEKCTNHENFVCQLKNAPKTKNFAKNFFDFFEKNSCKSFFGGYNRAHEKHIRCFSPLPFRTYGGFAMSTQKQINANQLMITLMDLIHEIKIHRASKFDELTKYQHRLLDNVIDSGMILTHISMDMPSKKEIGGTVSKLVNRMRYDMMDILSVKEMNCMNSLYGKYLVFISVAKDVLDKYLH